MSLKFTGELCVMAMKNDARFEEELTRQLKIDMMNFFIIVFFNCYLAAQRSTLGHSQGYRLTNPMLLGAFLSVSTRRSPGVL